MTFGDSIQVCFKKYADFNGRASKTEFWWFALFTFLVSLALSIVSRNLSALFSLATFVPSIAVGARRMHDTDKSGWMQLIGLIPLIGWIAVIILLAQDPKEPNRFGPGAAEDMTPDSPPQ